MAAFGNLLKLQSCRNFKNTLSDHLSLTRELSTFTRIHNNGFESVILKPSRTIQGSRAEFSDRTPAEISAWMLKNMYSSQKQINPCSSKIVHTFRPSLVKEKKEVQEALLKLIARAKHVAEQEEAFYIKKVHKKEPQVLHPEWQKYVYEFLPDRFVFPWSRDDDDKFSLRHIDHLKTVTFPQFLAESYNGLQKIAIGLEQVTWHQYEEHTGHEQVFKNGFDYCLAVLCELYTAIENHGLRDSVPRILQPDVQRSHMPDDIREQPPGGARDIRDYMILRDYINALNYYAKAAPILTGYEIHIQDYEYWKAE